MTTSIAQLLEAAKSQIPGATRAAGRLMSLMENQPQRLAELLCAMGPSPAEPRLILGVTGAPGSGKSTLVDQLVAAYRTRHPDHRVGVVAVDPSSPFTGGAVLGDRVRMMRHASDPMVYVRSLASRGYLGGLSLGVKGIVRVMGHIGCDVVFIETVGVGQSEVQIAQLADEVMIVLAPGQGDSIQLLKAGLMEIGDWFVINKADLPEAKAFHDSVLAALRMDREVTADLQGEAHAHEASYGPAIALVCASNGQGVSELVDSLEMHVAQDESRRQQRRDAYLRDDVREALLQAVRSKALRVLSNAGVSAEYVNAMLQGEMDIDAAAASLLERMKQD